MTNLNEYKQRLNNHDWWYMMSDDPKVFRRGAQAEVELRQIANQSEEHQKLYDEAKKNA